MYTAYHSVENGRHQNVDNVDFQHANNQAVFPPVTYTHAEVHAEPVKQPGRVKTNVNWMQNGSCQEQDLQAGGVVRLQSDGNGMNVNFVEKQRSVQQNICLPVTSNARDKYAESVRPKYSVTRNESSRYQEQVQPGENNPQKNVDYGEENVSVIVENVRSSIATDEDRVGARVVDDRLTAIVESEVVNKVRSNMESAAAVPVCDNVCEGRNSDARRYGSTDKSLQPFIASSISEGEVIIDTQSSRERTDVDTMAESAAAMQVFDGIYEAKISDARRRKSTDENLYAVQSVFTASVSNNEVVVDADDTMNLLETEDQCMVHDAASSAASKTVDQPPINSGS